MKKILLGSLLSIGILYALLIFYVFFSTFSIPDEWQDTSLKGLSLPEVHARLGKPHIPRSRTKGNFREEWHDKQNSDHWFLPKLWHISVQYKVKPELDESTKSIAYWRLPDDQFIADYAYIYREYFPREYYKRSDPIRIW